MRRLTFLLILILCSAPIFGQKTATNYEALARSITADLVARRFEQVVAHFSPEIAKVLDAPALAAAWDGVIGQYGAFGSIERVEQEEKGGLQVVYLTTVFARGKLTLTLVFDSNGRVVSFTATPPEARESWKPPEYAKPDSFTERAVTITTGLWQLPGTLTIPSGAGPFPGVVLVHGSGPNDQTRASVQTKHLRIWLGVLPAGVLPSSVTKSAPTSTARRAAPIRRPSPSRMKPSTTLVQPWLCWPQLRG